MRGHRNLSTLLFKDIIVKVFFIKFFIGCVLPAVLLMLAVIYLLRLPENSYDLAIIDKNIILADTKSPKIVLAGGSNLAFGVDSAAIQERFHIPVVNTAVNASFGLGRMLDYISPFLQTGDVLIIASEYDHFTSVWNGTSAAYEMIFDLREHRFFRTSYYGLPGGFYDFFHTRLRIIMDGLRNGIAKIFKQREQNKEDPKALSRNGFNEHGDYIKHLGMEKKPFDPAGNMGLVNKTYLKNFFRYVDGFTKRGITVVLSYPSYEEQSFRNSAAVIQELDTLLRAKENLLVISTPESYCYPTDSFHDTVYHLNMEARAVRTNQLIQDLQASGIFAIDP